MKTFWTILGIVVLGGLIWWLVARNDGTDVVNGQDNGEQAVCTLDARLCSDGSYVGRDPANNCEFRACPDGAEPVEEGDEEGVIFDKG